METEQTQTALVDTVIVPQTQTRLVDVIIADQNDALQLMVRFLALAQKRGVFMIDESAKIHECIKKFSG
jgi:glutathione synthase/RimK-type ligase-like ATP-grasp enzyme